MRSNIQVYNIFYGLIYNSYNNRYLKGLFLFILLIYRTIIIFFKFIHSLFVFFFFNFCFFLNIDTFNIKLLFYNWHIIIFLLLLFFLII